MNRDTIEKGVVILVFLIICIWTTLIVAKAYGKTVNNGKTVVATEEMRLANAAMYCQTDGAKERYGSTSHCYQYFLLKIKGDGDEQN